jgi:hypothetical protein
MSVILNVNNNYNACYATAKATLINDGFLDLESNLIQNSCSYSTNAYGTKVGARAEKITHGSMSDVENGTMQRVMMFFSIKITQE